MSRHNRNMALYNGESLYTTDGGEIPTLNPDWVIWLQENYSFAYDDLAGGSFTARKEDRRGIAYWYAFARIGDKTVKRYIGKSEQLDTKRLAEVAQQFKELRGKS